jgi:additional sex combs-like protein
VLILPNNFYFRLRHSSLTNEFMAKACQEWRERLLRGDFTPETIQKAKIDMEKDKQRIDSWKVRSHEKYKTFSPKSLPF